MKLILFEMIQLKALLKIRNERFIFDKTMALWLFKCHHELLIKKYNNTLFMWNDGVCLWNRYLGLKWKGIWNTEVEKDMVFNLNRFMGKFRRWQYF